MVSTPAARSPLSLPRVLHPAASELPQKPYTLVTHSHAGQAQYHTLIRTFWLIIVMLIILYPFIQFLSTCSFNQTPPLMTQLHIIQYVHAGSSHEPVTSAPSCTWPSSHIHLIPNLGHSTRASIPSTSTNTVLSQRKQVQFPNNTTPVGNIYRMLSMSLIFFVIKIWMVEFILSHWKHR